MSTKLRTLLIHRTVTFLVDILAIETTADRNVDSMSSDAASKDQKKGTESYRRIISPPKDQEKVLQLNSQRHNYRNPIVSLNSDHGVTANFCGRLSYS